MIHGPSLGIGAGITAVVFIVMFYAFNSFEESGLVIKQTPSIEKPNITMSTFLDNSSPVLGNPNAPIILVEFGDYQCHFCNVFFHETEESIVKNYIETGKVRMIFKDFTIIGPDSINAAHAAHCADEQGLFWEYHDILYNNWAGENNGWASSENLLRFANDIGLDVDQWSNCMIDGKYTEVISASNQDARTLELTGTPSFFIIGPDSKITKMYGAQPYAQFEKTFNSMLES